MRILQVYLHTMKRSSQKSVALLSVDDPDEQFIFATALRECHKGIEIMAFRTARELRSHLHHLEKICTARHLSDFIILADLKTPFFELRDISLIRELPNCKALPIYVFAESYLKICPVSAKDHGANGFYNKPDSLNAFRQLLLEMVLMEKDTPYSAS